MDFGLLNALPLAIPIIFVASEKMIHDNATNTKPSGISQP